MSPTCLRPSQSLLLVAVSAAILCGCFGKDDEKLSPAQENESPVSAVSFHSNDQFHQLDLRYRNGENSNQLAILESLGGGVGLLDYDLDGRLDVVTTGGGEISSVRVAGLPSRLIRQFADDNWEDVSSQANVDAPGDYSHGVCCGDWDQDGFTDLVITGYGGAALWQNQGDGTFQDVTGSSELDDRSWSTSAAFADLSGDGFPDLYLCHYVNWSLENNPACQGPSGLADVCPPRAFEGLTDSLFVNTGEGHFRDATSEVGLAEGGKGLGVLVADFDNDRDLDIYVANDTTNNYLYRNEGGFRFVERGLLSGTAVDHNASANGSMGLAASDYNRDGSIDLFVTNYEDEQIALYENLGADQFRHVSTRVGFNRIGTLYVGFGCAAADFNLDGLVDLCISNGHVVHHPRNAPLRQKPLLLLQQPSGTYVQSVPDGTEYFRTAHRGRGLATGDLNRDGSIDVVFTHINEPAEMLINRTEISQSVLSLRFIGTQSDRRGVGSRVTVRTGEQVRVQSVIGGGSYLSSSDRDLLFGVPGEEDITVTVEWLSGRVETIELNSEDLSSDGEVTKLAIVESRGSDHSGQYFIVTSH